MRRFRTPWEFRPRYSWEAKALARDRLTRRREILQQVERDVAAIKEQQPVASFPRFEWVTQFRRIDDHAFSLERFKPLEDLYRDDHPNICVMKPAQVGISEYAISYTIHAMIEGYKDWSAKAGLPKLGLNVAYCFPTREALKDFSKERFGGLKRESEYFAALFADADFNDINFKQINDSYLYLRGAWSEESLLSFPADLLILDEFDRMDPAAIELARKRLRQSVIKRQLCVSTPTLPGRGIDALYKLSDQRVWEVQCGKCRRYSALDFFRDVRGNGESHEQWKHWNSIKLSAAQWSVSCPNCKKDLDRFGPGRWRVTAPEATIWHGYHIPSLAFPSVQLDELALLAVSHDPTVQTEFYRSDLGIPYTPADSRLTAGMLKQLTVDYDDNKFNAMRWSRTTMGVDVGAKLHYRIDSTGHDGNRYIRAMGMVSQWEELTKLLNQYKVRMCIIDSLPELHKAKEWADKHPGRVRRAAYPTGVSELKGKLYALGSSEERKERTSAERKRAKAITDARSEAIDTDYIQIGRTMAMDAVYAQIASCDVICPPEIANDLEVIAEMTAPVRVVVKDDRGQERASWEHTAPDHLYHASVYCYIAHESLPRTTPGIVGQASSRGW